MTVDAFGRVLFTDGEGVDTDDMNGIGARVLAVLWDQIHRGAISQQAIGQGALDEESFLSLTASPYAIALTVQGARPRCPSIDFTAIGVTAGTLCQVIANDATGAEPTMLAYQFSGSEQVTISNGDPSNPRVDLVQMKLEYVNDTPTSRNFQDATSRALTSTSTNKRRRVGCTLSVKQGTPAASPVYPAPDAGNVVIAGIVVPTGFNGSTFPVFQDSASAGLVIHDQRMPIGRRAHGVHSNEFIYPDGGEFVSGGRIYVIRASGSSAIGVSMPLTSWSNSGRLLGVDCTFSEPSALVSSLARFSASSGNTTDLAGANMNGSGGGVSSRRYGGTLSFQALHAPVAGPVIQDNVSNGMGPPIWSNGFRAPSNLFTGESPFLPNEGSFLVIRYQNPAIGSRFYTGTFYLAEGL